MRLEERNEQLQAEKERLMYDMQRRGCASLDDDNRSAIRRGLQGGTSQPSRHFAGDTDPNEAGSPAPSDSPPPSLLPGPPSSSSSGPVADAAGQGFVEAARSEATTWEEAERAADADLAAACSLADLAYNIKDPQKVYVVQVKSPEAVGPNPAHATPTPEQALEEACHCIQLAHTDTDVFRVVNSLAVALGARRTETGTVKALHAALLQLVRPGMTNAEACTATGASNSNFSKWRRQVQKIQLDRSYHTSVLPPASSLASASAQGASAAAAAPVR